jgi:hypothetical protein
LIDVDGDGFNLTNASNGVNFNFSGDGQLRISWTAADSDDAFLVLDKNNNGMIAYLKYRINDMNPRMNLSPHTPAMVPTLSTKLQVKVIRFSYEFIIF